MTQDKKVTYFLPWRGEFGMMLMKWVRHVHGYQANTKIVCTTRGSEALYPSATEFFYDWEPVDDIKKNCRLLNGSDNHRYLCGVREQLRKVHPTAEFVYPTMYLPNNRAWNFTPQPKITRGLVADIVVGPRFRQYGMGRNFAHWQEIITKFNSWGLKVGAIGAANTSITNLANVVHKSWDYDFLDAGIELLRNCKLAIMSCSGPAHLAVLCGAPLKVIYDRPGKAVDGKGRWYMEDMQAFATAHCGPILHAWKDPGRIYEAVSEFFNLVK